MHTILHQQNKTELADKYRRSPAIWGDCPLSFIKKHYPEGHVRWDCSRMGLAPSLNAQVNGSIPGTKMWADTGGNIQGVSSINSTEVWGGAIELGVDTDNESATIAQAYPTFRMSGLSSNSNDLWFEACFALSSLATSTVGIFTGLAETEQWTLAAGVPFNGGDAITNAAAAIGWRKEEDGLGVLDTVISDRATSFTNIGDAAEEIAAAYTFVHVGFKYKVGPGRGFDVNKAVVFYKDNIAMDDVISKSTLTGYTNLDANALGPIFALIADSGGTAVKAYLKWLEVAQLPPGVQP
jgi:hypothetical protein